MMQNDFTTGAVSYGDNSWETTTAPVAKDNISRVKELIEQANTIPLFEVLKYYKMPTHQGSITCPFKHHKNGMEQTPSFKYFPNNNSFYCFGCKSGGQSSHSVKFVSLLEGINELRAAKKLLSIFETGEVVQTDEFAKDYYLKFNQLIRFSGEVRKFIIQNPHMESKIEEICQVYDKLNNKYCLSAVALERMTDQLIAKIYE